MVEKKNDVLKSMRFPLLPSSCSHKSGCVGSLTQVFLSRHGATAVDFQTCLDRRMGCKEEKLVSEQREKIFHIFRDFMTGITKIDELGNAGNRLLIGFQEAFEFLRRPPIDGTSELVDKIIVVNETKRVKSYVEAGCKTPHDGAQSVRKSKVVLNELEVLLEDATDSIQGTLRNLSPFSDTDLGDIELNGEAISNDKEEITLCQSQMKSHTFRCPDGCHIQYGQARLFDAGKDSFCFGSQDVIRIRKLLPDVIFASLYK